MVETAVDRPIRRRVRIRVIVKETERAMNPKKQPNDERYLQVLRGMTPTQKAKIVFDLSDTVHRRFKAGLRQLHPSMPEAELHALYLKRLAECHNRNY